MGRGRPLRLPRDVRADTGTCPYQSFEMSDEWHFFNP